jgi:hypothetical protein
LDASISATPATSGTSGRRRRHASVAEKTSASASAPARLPANCCSLPICTVNSTAVIAASSRSP